MKNLEPDGPGSFGGNVYTHPTFGMVSLSRISHTPINMFGSNLKHSYSVALDVSQATMQTTSHGERYYFAQKPLLRIILSPDQYVQAITSMNTSGVPCTIDHVGGVNAGNVPQMDALAEESKANVTEMLNDILGRFETQEKRIQDLFNKGKAGKTELRQIQEDFNFMRQELTKNIPFMLKQYERGMQGIAREIKTEVETFVTMRIQTAGIAAIQEQGGIRLPEPGQAFAQITEEGTATIEE